MTKAELAPQLVEPLLQLDPLPRIKRGSIRISQAITEKWRDENYRRANSGKRRTIKTRFLISLGIERALRDPEILRSYTNRLDKINQQRYGPKIVRIDAKRPRPKSVSDARIASLDLARDARYAERRLWITARKTGLLDKMIVREFLSVDELSVLYGYFELHVGSFPTKIMDKFSLAVANLA